MSIIQVRSEIGPLKRVMLHRPGYEVERLAPQYLERMLFDDIPLLKKAQAEHDVFADILRKEGVEVLYLAELLAESLTKADVKAQFIRDFLGAQGIFYPKRQENILFDYMNQLPMNLLIQAVTAGLLKKEVDFNLSPFTAMVKDDDPFLIDPLPNLYFTRDPAASIGNGISIGNMSKMARKRETVFITYIVKHHPRFASENIPLWHTREETSWIEGGDELVLTPDTIAVGMGERSTPESVETLALNLFNSDSGFKKVYAITIPAQREFMHLDTVMTMVDHDKFSIHPFVMKARDLRIFCLEPKSAHEVKVTEKTDGLQKTLEEIVHRPVTLIPCGKGDILDASREQWSDGSNTLALAPGVVCTYERNEITNASLTEHGLRVISFSGAELVRGRGGPRCMSMPMFRELI